MGKSALLSAVAFALMVGFVSSLSPAVEIEKPRKGDFCSWKQTVRDTRAGHCSKNQFMCLNNLRCIDRAYYCNGNSQCSDNSDEAYCNSPYSFTVRPCPSTFLKCRDSYKCIPQYFVCDGTTDCLSGEDESDCGDRLQQNSWSAISSALYWIKSQRNSQSTAGMWGAQVDKFAVALYFAEHNFTHSKDEIRFLAYETSIQFLSWFTTKKLGDIPSTELASFVNAFLVTCLNPRKFHGIDIVQELRNRVNKQNYTNPYVLLSLCNAGDTITEMDQKKLLDTFWNKHRAFWTDMQAFAVMALACASKQPGNDGILEELKELTMELKQHQYRNGSIENLQTTALVMQALLSAESERDPDNFDEKKAIEVILRDQKVDGSYGDLLNTYFVIPVLFCKSFVDINSDHCEFVQSDEISALENLEKQGGAKMRVQYSLWIGNERNLERNLALKVPMNMSLYGIMELAAEIDFKYKFEYIVKNRKPYINGISGLRDNPEKGKFWFLYKIKDGVPSPSQKSPADIQPKENDHYAMWYRSGSWVD